MEVELKVDDITAAHKAALKGKLNELTKLKQGKINICSIVIGRAIYKNNYHLFIQNHLLNQSNIYDV